MRADPLRSLLVVCTLTMGVLLIALTAAEGSLASRADRGGAAVDATAAVDGEPTVPALPETSGGSGDDVALGGSPPLERPFGDRVAVEAPLVEGSGGVVGPDLVEEEPAPPPSSPEQRRADAAEGSEPPSAGVPRIARVGSREAPCGFDVRRHAVARSVSRSEPAGTTGPFEANGQPLYFFVELTNRLENRQRARVVITHVASGTSLSGNVEVGVSSRWRTWVDLVPPPSLLGPWEARVLDSDRCLAAQFAFETIPPGWQ